MPIEISLPVCPQCRQVGKKPGPQTMTFFCTGPAGQIHKRTKMEPRLFREVVELKVVA